MTIRVLAVVALERIAAEVEYERDRPWRQLGVVVLLGREVRLPWPHAHRRELALVVVEEAVASAFGRLARPVVEIVHAIDVLLLLLLHLLDHVRDTRYGGQGR